MSDRHLANSPTPVDSSDGREHNDSTVERIMSRLDEMHTAREQAIREGRDIIRNSANAIRALHRGDVAVATALIDETAMKIQAVRTATAAHPSIYWAGYVQDAMKEYAEAAITSAILQNAPVPSPETLGVEDAAYLNGLAEAASELRRDCLDALRAADTERAIHLLDHMDTIYTELVIVDFPDAMTGGLRRTTDQLRAVLERTRGDVTLSVRQERLEKALRAREDHLR
ncbi:MAG: Translin family protein [uncultured Thermomicrobiales bacterium]|uniref:Translin family protein n=1 Tax=uncultured Thermomicrobiales bacterium TaxID=1645740 RepID=A0A6J4UX35_9BACT|nr:MAG: Translin family protein [uncultured Thermomicrobiales bacterium]